MTLIQRQDALVAKLEPIYRERAKRGWFGEDLIGKRSKLKRLHREEMIEAGYTKKEAGQSAEQCDQVAYRNVDFEVAMAPHRIHEGA